MTRITAVSLLLCACISTSITSARTLHVDAKDGNDRRDGLAHSTALRSIQRAADLAQAGDEIIIHPGIYFERVTLAESKRGTASAPIIFRADRIAKNRVILSGAVPTIRNGKTPWKLIDPDTSLYAIEHAGPPPPPRHLR